MLPSSSEILRLLSRSRFKLICQFSWVVVSDIEGYIVLEPFQCYVNLNIHEKTKELNKISNVEQFLVVDRCNLFSQKVIKGKTINMSINEN